VLARVYFEFLQGVSIGLPRSSREWLDIVVSRQFCGGRLEEGVIVLHSLRGLAPLKSFHHRFARRLGGVVVLDEIIHVAVEVDFIVD